MNIILSKIKSKQFLIIGLILILTTAAIFWQVRGFEFINLDDNRYVLENRHVPSGLTVPNILWALSTTELESWQPLTWLSFMLDANLYGSNAGGFHFTNLLLHLLSTILLFWLINRMTGAVWRAAFVAAFFAIHPVHVESVAWVAERKDTLSAFFFMLTLCLYVRYAEKPDMKRYALVLLSFIFGLMSKPMLVTLPVILILLDYWPLKRLQNKKFALRAVSPPAPVADQEQKTEGQPDTPAALPASPEKTVEPSLWVIPIWQIKEKLPMFLLALIPGIAVMMAQVTSDVIPAKALHPLCSRLANAFVSYITYMINILTPYNLGVFYPFNEQIPLLTIIVSVLLFVALCLAAILTRKRFPFILVGWFWFVIMLAPVIGIVMFAKHAMADRYTYLSAIGISFILAWGIPLIFKTDRLRKIILMPIGIIYVVVLGYLAWVQCGYWENSISLFEHTIKVTTNNVLHYNLGLSYLNKGDLVEGKRHMLEAVRINPQDDKTHTNLGMIYLKEGDISKAVFHFNEGLKLNQNNFVLHYNFAVVLEQADRIEEAIAHYKRAIELNPKLSFAHYNYANLLLKQGKPEEAAKEFRLAIAANPDYEDARFDLAELLVKQGKEAEAISQYRAVIKINPGHLQALNALGLMLAKAANYDEAIECYRKAAAIAPDNAELYFNLGLLFSKKGDIPSAAQYFQTAMNLNPNFNPEKQPLNQVLKNSRRQK